MLSPCGHWAARPDPPAQGKAVLAQHTEHSQCPAMENCDDTEEPPLPLVLSRFQISEEFGFLLPNPLVGAGCASAGK